MIAPEFFFFGLFVQDHFDYPVSFTFPCEIVILFVPISLKIGIFEAGYNESVYYF